jgi:hypothetical protein
MLVLHTHDILAEAGVRLPAGTLGAAPLPPGRLADLARHLAGAAALWRPGARPGARLADPAGSAGPADPAGSAGPARTRLLWTPAVEAWLVEWAPGQTTGVHDHGGAATALCVVEGALAEECLDVTIWTTCRRTTWRAPATAAFDPGHVHLVGNAGGGVAASVHVRSPASRAPASCAPGARARPAGAGTGSGQPVTVAVPASVPAPSRLGATRTGIEERHPSNGERHPRNGENSTSSGENSTSL